MLDKESMIDKYGFYNENFTDEDMYTASIHYPNGIVLFHNKLEKSNEKEWC